MVSARNAIKTRSMQGSVTDIGIVSRADIDARLRIETVLLFRLVIRLGLVGIRLGSLWKLELLYVHLHGV